MRTLRNLYKKSAFPEFGKGRNEKGDAAWRGAQ
jgi:hypothetical protein